MLHACAHVLIALGVSMAVASAPHDPEGRLALLSARIAAEPFAAAPYLERAGVLAQMSEPARALLDYERSAELDPESPAAALGRAETLFALERDAEALVCLDRAMALGAGTPRVAWLRGQMLQALGRTGDAARVFHATLSRLPAVRPEHFLELALAVGAAGDLAAAAAATAVLARGIDELGPVPALVTAAVELDLRAGAFDLALQRVDALAARAARPAPWLLVRAELLDRAGRGAEAGLVRAQAAAGLSRHPAAAGTTVPEFGAAPPLAMAAKTLVPRGAVWRYRDDNSVTGTAWRQPAFDDSGWPSGAAQLGYGDGDEATITGFGPSSTNRYITTWFRSQFSVDPVVPFTYALLRLLRDDGAVVYVDGVEVVRSNMPAGAITSTTLASAAVAGADESAWLEFYIDPTRLGPGTHTVAVEVHQNVATSTDISFDLELVTGVDAAPISRRPYLQDGTPDGAVLRWRTATPTTTALWIGPQPTRLQRVYFDPTPVTDHSAVIRGLPAETRYYYGVGDIGGLLAGGDAQHFFTTLPPAGAVRPLRCWVLGDSGTATALARAVRDQYVAFAGSRKADMLLMLGDNAYSSGTDAEYQAAVFNTYPEVLKNTFTWSTLGNHDAGSASSSTQTGVYYDTFDLPRQGEAGGLPSGTEAYYSFDRGHVHFVCLDSQDTNRTATGAMMQWLQADLASTAAPWVVAFFHHPPYTKGTHDSDNTGDSGGRMQDMRQVALPILEAHGVDLVLTGHSHVYERSYLIDGHYGMSSTFQPSMILDRGDGRADGDGSYAKAAAGRGVHDGAVYVVAGSSGQSGSGSLDHPAMFLSMSAAGSLVIDVDGNQLDATFVTDTGVQADRFRLAKDLRRSLRRDTPALSVGSGGTQGFALAAGTAFAGMNYQLAGALGTTPGLSFGGFHVPLNNDAFLQLSLGLANSSAYPGSVGTLDANGNATAALVLPAGVLLGGAGLSLYHAYIVFDATGVRMVSNAVRVRLLP